MKIIVAICSTWNYHGDMDCRFSSRDKVIALMGRAVGQANRFIMHKLKEHGIEGLVPSHGNILALLFNTESMSMKDLSAGIHRQKNTVTTLVDKLIAWGYVKKDRDEADLRYFRVSLTEKARHIRQDFLDISDELLDITYQGFSEAEKVRLTSYLERIIENLQ